MMSEGMNPFARFNLRVLVLFESSGTMREAFRSRGVEAYSCDLQAADDDSPHHYQCDVMDMLDPFKSDQWDAIIMHPTCTAMCVSANHVYAEGKPKYHERVKAVEYTEHVWNLAKSKAQIVILENPVGVLPTMSDLPKPQYVQPYMFGDDASKNTGLFMHGIGPLKIDPANRLQGRFVEWKGKLVERWSNQCDSGQNRLGPKDDRWKVRSKTYPGVADALASHVINQLTVNEEHYDA